VTARPPRRDFAWCTKHEKRGILVRNFDLDVQQISAVWEMIVIRISGKEKIPVLGIQVWIDPDDSEWLADG
jgi:hypothetical protein